MTTYYKETYHNGSGWRQSWSTTIPQRDGFWKCDNGMWYAHYNNSQWMFNCVDGHIRPAGICLEEISKEELFLALL